MKTAVNQTAQRRPWKRFSEAADNLVSGRRESSPYQKRTYEALTPLVQVKSS